MKAAAMLCVALLACSAPAAGQWPGTPPLAVEVSAGYAVPTGDFADARPGIGAEPGPRLGTAVLWRFAPALAAFAGYSRSWFGCGRCAAQGLDDRVVDAGVGGGIQLSAPALPASPWVRAGALYHQLLFSDGGEALSSDWATGYGVGAGVGLGLSPRLILRPGVRYRSYSTRLELGPIPDEEVDVTHLTADVMVEYRF